MNHSKLLPIVLAACLATPVTAAERFVIDFRTAMPGSGPIGFSGPNAASMVKTDNLGLRINIPSARPEPYADIGVEIFIRIVGDCEISIGYELLNVGEPIPEFGAGVKMRVDFESPTPLAATITRLRKPPAVDAAPVFHPVGAKGETFGAVRIVRGKNGQEEFQTRNFRAGANTGRLKLVRVGPQLQFWAAESGTDYHLLHTLEVGTSDVSMIRALASSGNRGVATSVRLTDLIIETQTTPAVGAAARPAADRGNELRPDPAPTAGPQVMLWLAILTLVLVGFGGAFLVGRKSAAAPNRIPLVIVMTLITVLFGCSIYANRAFAVKDGADYRYFPPFRPHANANMNDHLGAEYFNIARSLYAGDGFANPFPGKTGPTAWMTPVLPAIEAVLLWLCNGNRESVMGIVVFLQVYALIVTGLLVLVVARRTASNFWSWAALAIYLGAVVSDFHAWFQYTHDCWLILLALDLVVAAIVWTEPMRSWKTACGWGALGGFCALVSPIVGFLWAVLTVLFGIRGRLWSRIAIAALAACLVVAPWTLRNYAVFGRLIPVKSNAAYELYQSQCLQPDGLIQNSTFATHPYRGGNREAAEYKELGEIAFLDRKKEQFWQAVRENPTNFLDRVADRLLGTTVWYTPYERTEETKKPWVFWTARVLQPLPFLAVLFLVFSARRRPLHPVQWAVIGIYVLYLLPYIAVSYYNRYGFPLLGVKVLLVIWGVDRLVSWRRLKGAAIETQRTPARAVAPSRAAATAVGAPA